MAFVRDHGTCCVFLPLKLGIYLVSMAVFMDGVLCVVATFTADIRFQPNGYNERFYRLPTFVGVFGLFLGFIGLLGTHDDKPAWIQWLVYFLFLKFLALFIACAADYSTLFKCDSWLSSTERLTHPNEQLTALAESGVCPWARLAYTVGAAMLLAFWAYCTYHAYTYWKQVQCNPSYPIDFGHERHGTSGRWDAFQVKDPRLPENEEGQPLLPQHMMHEEEEATPAPAYGTAEHNRYGPDAQEMADMEP
ncbi:unnamed protein product [Effrenium voratum]|uniref:Uncharacterized protein n=1 Tax=Effrenium voratum TaxID=2562239 RepID=A0AA36N2M5_9DINO|nr:unnamed protein product [Effrenium voratum]